MSIWTDIEMTCHWKKKADCVQWLYGTSKKKIFVCCYCIRSYNIAIQKRCVITGTQSTNWIIKQSSCHPAQIVNHVIRQSNLSPHRRRYTQQTRPARWERYVREPRSSIMWTEWSDLLRRADIFQLRGRKCVCMYRSGGSLYSHHGAGVCLDIVGRTRYLPIYYKYIYI